MNATEFCKLVESRLGWLPPAGQGWKRYSAMAGRVNRKIATNPALYTMENLQLAVELLAKERLPRNPLGVFAHVPRAVAMSIEDEADVEQGIRVATAIEQGKGDPDGWVTRFARAVGPYRLQALNEWRASR